mgnify:CR=1 FL=1
MYKAVWYVKNYIQETSGAIIVIFAIALPVLVGMVGLATDSALAYLERERLSRACDAAGLAAASSSVSTNAQLHERFTEFFEANFPPQRYGSVSDIRLYLDEKLISPNNELAQGDILKAEIDTTYDVTFARVFGIKEINMGVKCAIQKEVGQLEVALVLDVTGSMAGSKIKDLRVASTDFINIIYDRVPNEDLVRIALVPYASTVNVGDAVLDHPSMFDLPPGYTYDPNDDLQWHGCVMARETPYDYQDTGAGSLEGGPWQAFIYPEGYDNDYIDSEGNLDLNLPYTEGNNRRTPNLGCPSTDPIQPLISDRSFLLDLVTGSNTSSGDDDGDPGLKYWSRGGTFGNLGMVWGLRVLSPEAPFEQGVPFNDPKWRKAIIMMTDGVNQVYDWTGGPDTSDHTAYGRLNNMGPVEIMGTTDKNEAEAEATRRFSETCKIAKEEGIVIYTVVFGNATSDTDLMKAYKNCASDSNKFYPSPDGEDLKNAFKKIARELSNLHLKS